jgi:hypothetical protein
VIKLKKKEFQDLK